MSLIDNFFVIVPDQWLFAAHRDVVDGKRRAQDYFDAHANY